MLMNLSPRQPATLHWPLYSYPPPHLLVGYQYLVRVCNDYIFETRAYSRISFTEVHLPMQQMMNWSVMANCSYTINTGAYHRFINLDNFEETLLQVQQAVLAERVVADLALIRPMQGFGVTNMGTDRGVPVEQLLQDHYKHLGQCQDQAWGMANRIRIQRAGNKDITILSAIRQLKNAYFNFLISESNPNTNLSLPSNSLWLHAFVEKFADPQLSDSRIREIPTQRITKCIINALSLPQIMSLPPMTGGAFELRPRENGRAVTQTMRIRRGEVVQQFIESLPFRRRKRRRVQDDEQAGPSRQIIEELPASPIDISESEEEEELQLTTFEQEVQATVAEAIRLLQEELTVSARDEQFFNFTLDFYNVLQRLESTDSVNESNIRRWVMYFFVAEHAATTLNYFHHAFRLYAPFSRWVDLNLAQVVMRARDEEGQVVYSRVWSETGINSFSNVMFRISNDLAATVERAGLGELDEDEVEQFMADIAYNDNSGDVEEILRQVAANDRNIDSVELSFRVKVTGPVVFSQNRQIQITNQRVIALASRLRQHRMEMPQLNQRVQLPPL